MLVETAGAWEQAGRADGEVRDIIGAVDATFLEQMMLVFLDVSTGSLLREAVADDRTSTTGKTLGDERLTALGTGVLSLVSDRAQALIQLAEQGLECLSRPDFFPVMPDLAQGYALAMARRVRQAHQALQKAEAAISTQRPGADGPRQAALEVYLSCSRGFVYG